MVFCTNFLPDRLPELCKVTNARAGDFAPGRRFGPDRIDRAPSTKKVNIEYQKRDIDYIDIETVMSACAILYCVYQSPNTIHYSEIRRVCPSGNNKYYIEKHE